MADREISGKTLIDWGFSPGPWFNAALSAAEDARARGADDNAIKVAAAAGRAAHSGDRRPPYWRGSNQICS